MPQPYLDTEPARADVDAMPGITVLDFGTNWCGHCRAAQPLVDAAVQSRAGLRHIKVEDGPGRRLGRSFRVTLWPTLVVMRDGRELARVVRPGSAEVLAQALASLDAPAPAESAAPDARGSLPQDPQASAVANKPTHPSP